MTVASSAGMISNTLTIVRANASTGCRCNAGAGVARLRGQPSASTTRMKSPAWASASAIRIRSQATVLSPALAARRNACRIGAKPSPMPSSHSKCRNRKRLSATATIHGSVDCNAARPRSVKTVNATRVPSRISAASLERNISAAAAPTTYQERLFPSTTARQ